MHFSFLYYVGVVSPAIGQVGISQHSITLGYLCAIIKDISAAKMRDNSKTVKTLKKNELSVVDLNLRRIKKECKMLNICLRRRNKNRKEEQNQVKIL